MRQMYINMISEASSADLLAVEYLSVRVRTTARCSIKILGKIDSTHSLSLLCNYCSPTQQMRMVRNMCGVSELVVWSAQGRWREDNFVEKPPSGLWLLVPVVTSSFAYIIFIFICTRTAAAAKSEHTKSHIFWMRRPFLFTAV